MERLTISGFSDEISPDFDAQLEAVKEFGLTRIELRGADGVNVSDLTPDKLREVKLKLAENGIAVSSIGSPVGKSPIGADFAPQMEKLKRTLEIQKELGAPYVRIFSFYIPKDRDPADFREEVLDKLYAFTEEAKRWNSVLLHENEKGIYGDTAPRCLEILQRLAGPNLKAVFDFANFVEVGQETLPAYELLKPYIAYVHIKDAVWDTKQIVPAGRGDGHVREILTDLIGGGYRGFLSMEPHLVNFTGLSALEQDAKHRETALDGKSAWKLALDSLRALLAEIPGAREAAQV